MTEGLLEAVFATSTVAAGVNFPARCVVFLTSDRFNGHEFVPLSATEFHQTTGRAGRRGKDRIGFAVVLPGKFTDLRLMAALCKSPPEDVRSQIKVDFSMVLNLLLSHTLEMIRDVFEKSFATFLNLVDQQEDLARRIDKAAQGLTALVPERICVGPEALLALVRKRADLNREFDGLTRNRDRQSSLLRKLSYLTPGRLFLDSRDRLYVVVRERKRGDEKGVLACRVKGKAAARGKRMKLRWFGAPKVALILDEVVELPDVEDGRALRHELIEIANAAPPPALGTLVLSEEVLDKLRPLDGRLRSIDKAIEALPCSRCSHLNTCHGNAAGPFPKAFEAFTKLWDSANAARTRLWNDFERHLTFLKDEGFVDADDRLTHDGAWTSQLRLDQPLMIAEGLRRGIFSNCDAAMLAALVAPFVQDREGEDRIAEAQVPRKLLEAVEQMRSELDPLSKRKALHGFEVRPILLWPSVVLYAWANGESWERILGATGMEEGDLAMMVSRTADNLRQIASLSHVYPDVSKCALEGIAKILRDPVVLEPVGE